MQFIFLISLIYLSLFNLSAFVDHTYSYFNDSFKAEGLITNMQNFCDDNPYLMSHLSQCEDTINEKCNEKGKNHEFWKEHKDLCKDNSGLGNGCEPVDDSTLCEEGDYDPDNPAHKDPGDTDDHNNGDKKDEDKNNKHNKKNTPDGSPPVQNENSNDTKDPESEQSSEDNSDLKLDNSNQEDTSVEQLPTSDQVNDSTDITDQSNVENDTSDSLQDDTSLNQDQTSLESNSEESDDGQ